MEENFDEIKSAFEQHFQEKLPKDFWADIAMDLNREGELSEDSIASKIKESFENQPKKTAPPLFWDAIENELPLNELSENKIKQSFEVHYHKNAPEYIWNALRQQINIDAVWTRIELVLGKKTAQQKLSNRLSRWMSYAALFVFMHACLPTHYYQKEILLPKPLNLPMAAAENDGDISKNTNLEDNIKSNKATEPKLNKENNSVAAHNNKETANIFNKNWQDKTANKKISGLRKKQGTDKNETAGKLNKQDNYTGTKTGLLNTEAGNKEHIIPPIFDKEGKNATITAISEGIPVNLSLSAYSLPTISAALIAEAQQKLPKVAEFKDLKTADKELKDKDLSRLQVGIIAFAGVGGMNNAETKAGYAKGSLLENKLCPSIGYGLFATFKFNSKNALAVEFDLQNKIRHQIHFFSKDGRHAHKIEEFDYTRLVLMYQRNMLQWKAAGNLKSLVSLRGGLYAGYMKTQNSFYNDVEMIGVGSLFKKMDFGAKFMLGQSHNYEQIVFEYGLSSDIGVYNIFEGVSAYTSIQVNRSNIFSAGAYASLRYKF